MVSEIILYSEGFRFWSYELKAKIELVLVWEVWQIACFFCLSVILCGMTAKIQANNINTESQVRVNLKINDTLYCQVHKTVKKIQYEYLQCQKMNICTLPLKLAKLMEE